MIFRSRMRSDSKQLVPQLARLQIRLRRFSRCFSPGEAHRASSGLSGETKTARIKRTYGVRTISTEHLALRATDCATLPSKNRRSPLLPCDPTTMRSACHSPAISRIAVLVSASTTRVLLTNPASRRFGLLGAPLLLPGRTLLSIFHPAPVRSPRPFAAASKMCLARPLATQALQPLAVGFG